MSARARLTLAALLLVYILAMLGCGYILVRWLPGAYAGRPLRTHPPGG